jgi:biopolymer transport protein ExbB
MFHHILLQTATSPAVTSTVTAIADTAKAAAAAGAPSQAQMSLIDLVKSGGPIMYPLGFLSLLTVYFFIERYMFIKRASKMSPNFVDSLKDFIHNNNIDAAKAFCKNTDSPQARIMLKGITKLNKPITEIETSLENAGRIEAYKLEKNVNILGIIAGIAPMFGFIGTILGVIKIFYNISLDNNISIGHISGGLYEKMITSATGLAIGIFAFIAYHWLTVMVNRSIKNMEITSIDFMEMIQEEGVRK